MSGVAGTILGMTDVPRQPADLLPIVYAELRRLAAARMASEKPGHTLDATALVHEAYLRLTGDQSFTSKSHFMRASSNGTRCRRPPRLSEVRARA